MMIANCKRSKGSSACRLEGRALVVGMTFSKETLAHSGEGRLTPGTAAVHPWPPELVFMPLNGH